MASRAALAATILATGLTVAGVTAPASAATSVPRFNHVVLVMFENHANTLSPILDALN